MFSPIQETFKNISKEKGLFFSSLISLITIFVLLDTFIFGVFNLNDFKAKMENLNQAASIAGMFLMIECVIVDKKEENPAPQMPMGGGMGGMM